MTNPASTLTGSHLRTYTTIFQHPLSHNLQWQAVRGLLERLGELSETPNGNLKVTRNGQTLVLQPSRTKDVAESDEVMALRHFLERSEIASEQTGSPEARWLLVIDHREARIFHADSHGTLPEQILPHAPEDFFRHAPDSKDSSRGKEKPDPNSFFEPVAKALQGAGKILVFGSGTGTSSEMEQFVAWVKIHHPAVARKIVGAEVVDAHHLTLDELLAKARELFAHLQTLS